jgi:hypothetical protein
METRGPPGFSWEHGLENAGGGYTIRDRTNAVAKHLLANIDELNDDGENVVDAVVSEIVHRTIGGCQKSGFLPGGSWKEIREFDIEAFRERYPALDRALLGIRLRSKAANYGACYRKA